MPKSIGIPSRLCLHLIFLIIFFSDGYFRWRSLANNCAVVTILWSPRNREPKETQNPPELQLMERYFGRFVQERLLQDTQSTLQPFQGIPNKYFSGDFLHWVVVKKWGFWCKISGDFSDLGSRITDRPGKIFVPFCKEDEICWFPFKTRENGQVFLRFSRLFYGRPCLSCLMFKRSWSFKLFEKVKKLSTFSASEISRCSLFQTEVSL